MKFNRYTLLVLFAIVLISLGALLIIQFKILKKDIKSNQTKIEFAIPGILSDLYDNMMFNRALRRHTNTFLGTINFDFTSTSNPTDSLEIILKNGIDQVLELNYPHLDYHVNGFLSSEYGCVIHRNHRPELPRASKIFEAENHLCFCMMLNRTLDIAMSYSNKEEAAIDDSAELLRASFLLIIINVGIFGYAFYTIRRQRKLSDLKRDFINNLTHEFKTPIFSISLAAKTLSASETINQSEKMNSYVELISHEAKRLQTHVDKILQLAMLDAGHLTLEKKKIDIHESIRHVVSSFAIIIAEKKGDVRLSLKATDHFILADETHFNNILYNLIDNAQKYTEGVPDIEIITRDSEGGVVMTVKDRGMGMDKTTQRFAFDQFYRAQRGDVHNVKGFGIGLSYVKKIVEFHKGKIRLTSELGKGTEFNLIFPIS